MQKLVTELCLDLEDIFKWQDLSSGYEALFGGLNYIN